ncbi:hypothetical protein K488DRAFT_89695 [Vararia minispora EC-137]|uniref:Uncharacterized protein n=1 Tax=Vararia minispora EC-137 TaxID=1314806 RepID=A0ACB8QA48_9AGAM|nr:hypothetical protein K488DRAFT_89695 [Vararia minispora EC-137]
MLMIGQSFPEYVFIRTAIIALRLVAPSSAVYIVLSLYNGWSLFNLFGLYALAEVLFYLLVFLPRRARLQATASDAPRLSASERRTLFTKCAQSMTADSASGWFTPSAASKGDRDAAVGADDARDWLLWSLFSATPGEVLDEWHEELDAYAATLAQFLGYPLRRGRNAERRALRLSFDPVVALHRPLLWYTIVALVDAITCVAMRALGFDHYDVPGAWRRAFPPRPVLALLALFSPSATTPDIPYWYRPHRAKDKLPILFLHGIGIGLWPYLPFLRELVAQDPDIGILALELLPISARITSPPPPRPALLTALTNTLDAHRLPRAVLAAHSYGTALAAYALRHPPLANRIPAALLVDPIPFLLHHPAVAYNFVYRAPRTANEWQLWYFAARDPDVARALGRHFHWFEAVLFREDLGLARPVHCDADGAGPGRRVAVALAGRDQLVDAPAVRRYLTGEDEPRERWEGGGLEVLFFEGEDHATVFDDGRKRRMLREVVRRFVRVA